MKQAVLNQSIVNEFQTALGWLDLSDKDLLLMASSMSAGLKMAGASSGMLDFAVTSGQLREMAKGELLEHRT